MAKLAEIIEVSWRSRYRPQGDDIFRAAECARDIDREARLSHCNTRL